MSRGRTPVVAIGEAQRRAQAEGFVLILVEAEIKLPFDFVISDRGCISLVRVRRLKYAQYRVAVGAVRQGGKKNERKKLKTGKSGAGNTGTGMVQQDEQRLVPAAYSLLSP